jgi:hypothetical protein
MKSWPLYPVIYENNNCIWLGELSLKYQRAVDLVTVPQEEWDQITSQGSWTLSPGQMSSSSLPFARGFGRRYL